MCLFVWCQWVQGMTKHAVLFQCHYMYERVLHSVGQFKKSIALMLHVIFHLPFCVVCCRIYIVPPFYTSIYVYIYIYIHKQERVIEPDGIFVCAHVRAQHIRTQYIQLRLCDRKIFHCKRQLQF